jgi:hypothetical protein
MRIPHPLIQPHILENIHTIDQGLMNPILSSSPNAAVYRRGYHLNTATQKNKISFFDPRMSDNKIKLYANGILRAPRVTNESPVKM